MSEVKKIEAYLVMRFSRRWMVKQPRRSKTLRKQKKARKVAYYTTFYKLRNAFIFIQNDTSD